MGKPQKSKKHKKLKTTFDPENPLKSFRQKKGQRNLRPENDEEQEIPRKVKDIMGFKSKGKGKQSKKHKKYEAFKMVRGMSAPLKPAPVFVQKKEETEKEFMRRVDFETNAVVTKAMIEEKYKIQIEDGDGLNKPTIKREKSERKKQKVREKKKKKQEGKIMKKLDRAGDFADFRDDIQFGETVMQPPSLTTLPKKAQKEDATAKPGKRSLLLKQMIQGGSAANEVSHNLKVTSLANRQAGQTVKRKFLSPAQQQISDFQRNKAIELYRQMKERKLK